MRMRALGFICAVLTAVPVLANGAMHGGAIPGSEVQFYLGVFEPRGSSELWEENEEFLTQDVSDFDDVIGGFAFAAHLNPHLDILYGAEYYQKEIDVRYQNIFTTDGDAIRQDHRLRELPIEVSVRFLLVPRQGGHGAGAEGLRAVVPYLGGGAGALAWDYLEEGQFVDDPENPTVAFRDSRKAEGVAGVVSAFAGVEVQLSREIALWTEGRYRWAEDDLGSDFDESLDSFDLSGGSIVAGVSIRF